MAEVEHDVKHRHLKWSGSSKCSAQVQASAQGLNHLWLKLKQVLRFSRHIENDFQHFCSTMKHNLAEGLKERARALSDGNNCRKA